MAKDPLPWLATTMRALLQRVEALEKTLPRTLCLDDILSAPDVHFLTEHLCEFNANAPVFEPTYMPKAAENQFNAIPDHQFANFVSDIVKEVDSHIVPHHEHGSASNDNAVDDSKTTDCSSLRRPPGVFEALSAEVFDNEDVF